MANPSEIEMSLMCRLCLAKDRKQVTIPIFEDHGDIRQIFLKISSCLPIKITKEDQLPKNICDGCSDKLDLLYEFWNTSLNSEKTLLFWLAQAGLKDDDDPTIGAHQQIVKPVETLVKEEIGVAPNLDLPQDEASEPEEEPEAEEPPKKRARRTAAVKAQIQITPESEDDDDDEDNVMMDEPESVDADAIAKLEEDSEESDGEEKVPPYADVPGTSAQDQPGTSGLGKDGAEAPYFNNAWPYSEHLEVEMEISEQEFKPLKIVPKKMKIKEETNDDARDKDYSPGGPQKKKKNKSCDGKAKPKKKKQEHKLWTCRKCLQEFDSRKSLTEHSSKNHSADSISDEHSFKHDPVQNSYRCNTCTLEYSTQKEVENHIQKIHEEFYACDVCNHTSKKAYAFALHMKTHSDDDMMVCPLCSYSTQRRTCLQTHINRVHYHKFYYTCDVCNKGFNDSVIYKEHNNEHLGIKPFICVVCDKAFCYSRYMNIHQVRHHTVYIEGTLHKTQCSICLKVFSKVDTLLKHITSKHKQGEARDEKRHLCDLCGKGFGSSDKLKIHYRIHTGEKPYHCKFCEKCFTKKDYLIMHERVHTGEKPYPCEHCGKCFNQACSLRIHVRGHTGERPYICQFCNGGYISRGSLNLHMKSCNGVKVG